MITVNSFFDFVNNIAFSKIPIEINIADDKLYSAYITNRYLTFYSKKVVNAINTSVNMYGSVFDAHNHYKFMFNLIPKSKPRFIRYVKKKKTTDEAKDIEIKTLCDHLEVSKRELNLYSQKFNINIQKYG